MAPTTRRSAKTKAPTRKQKKKLTPEQRKALDALRNKTVRRETSGGANKIKTILAGLYNTGVCRPHDEQWAKNRTTLLTESE